MTASAGVTQWRNVSPRVALMLAGAVILSGCTYTRINVGGDAEIYLDVPYKSRAAIDAEDVNQSGLIEGARPTLEIPITPGG